MNRSYSKIRHIQEANARLEMRVIKEDFESSIKRRIPALEELIDFEINDNSSDDFKDEFEYASNIINWVADAFIQLPENSQYEDEYDDIIDYLKTNYGEMIMSHYEEGDDDWDGEDDDDEWVEIE